jgi:predicted nucleotidyltransferase
MNISQPYTALSPTLDSEVLAVLARTRRPLTGREVMRLTGRTSHGGVLDALNRLAEHGVVERQEAGRAYLFTLNRDHLAAPAVEALAGMRSALLARIRGAVDTWRVSPIHLSLFGSMARGEGDAQSDIDVFVVRPSNVSDEDAQWRTQVDRLARNIERWTGNRASVSEATQGEIDGLIRDERPIIEELRSDAIVLKGADIPALLGGD